MTINNKKSVVIKKMSIFKECIVPAKSSGNSGVMILNSSMLLFYDASSPLEMSTCN